ncbi:VCBS domain-containing protein, partial [Vibrio sinaloensis]|uniref:VCBS domain-containing protein n=1 Tax=Photobacterium sp. (strain ATCC 43367) TaxID=379097 RepID=UPI0035EAC91D
MNMKSLATIALANTTVVIDTNGQIRELLPGEVPGPGDVVVVLGQGSTAATEVGAQIVNDDGGLNELNLDNEIAAIFEQIEQGVDPTQNEDFATAAGGQNGSSPTGSGDIERTGAETLASTSFDTTGLESQGLSETQSLALLELVEDSLTPQAIILGDDNVREDETDEPLVLNGTLIATDTDDPTFVPQDNVQGSYGVFSIDAEGNWTYTADSAYDELNIGDLVSDIFEVESSDGTLSTVTVTIDGTNDLPEFVEVGQEPIELSPFAVDSYSFDYSEGTDAGVTIGQVAATDPDNSVLIFSISSNLQDGDGNDLYQIDSETGEISLTEAGAAAYVNDFEVLANSHTIEVTVTEGDGIGEPQSATVDVFLNEQNIDDNPPVFEGTDPETGTYAFAYEENVTDDYVIGTVSATDPDGENVTYSITVNVTNDADEPLFEIDSVSGEISLTAAGVVAFTNDFELAANVHNITVTATEDEGLGEVNSTDINVELSELNVDEGGPIFYDDDEETPVENYAFEYNENSLDSDVIGTVLAIDGDGENVTYSITNNVT